MPRKMVAQLVYRAGDWMRYPPRKELSKWYSSITAIHIADKRGWWVWNEKLQKWEARFTRVYYN